MRALGIQSLIRRKKFKYISPENIIQAKAVANILNRDFSATAINQKWVTDITYLYFGQSRNKAYLSALINLYTKEIISSACIKENIGVKTGLIIHSNQDFHYTSYIYKELFKIKKYYSKYV